MNKSSDHDKKRAAHHRDGADARLLTPSHPSEPQRNTLSSPPVATSYHAPTTEQTELFDRSRMQWQFGDWESMADISWQTIEQHPQRAQLALLTSTAHQQLGHAETARCHAIHALEWGCDKHQAAQILISCAHNTLARAAALRHEESRALDHFRNSVHGVSGDTRLACQARSVREVARLDLVDQAARVIKGLDRPDPGKHSDVSIHGPHAKGDSARTIAPSLSSSIPVRKRNRKSDFEKQTIVIAGMRHSGSTALFNIVRLALKQKGVPFTSFYSEGKNSELLNDPQQGLILVKTHELRDDVLTRADTIITTRRDLRDTVASAKRREFPLLRKLGSEVEYAKYNRSLHDQWLPYSDYEFVYEAFLANPVEVADQVLALLNLTGVDADALCAEVNRLPTDEYDITLLSPMHITDPQKVRSFRDTLTDVQTMKITSDHATWLQRYGYGTARGSA